MWALEAPVPSQQDVDKGLRLSSAVTTLNGGPDSSA